MQAETARVQLAAKLRALADLRDNQNWQRNPAGDQISAAYLRALTLLVGTGSTRALQA